MDGLRPPKSLILTENRAIEWKNWATQFKYYSVASGLDKKSNEVQVATLLTCIGQEGMKIFETFALANEALYADIIKKFDTFFTPKLNVTYERYIFNGMNQASEKFNEFLTKVKLQAAKCNYGDLEEELIRDKLIISISSQKIREKLLQQDELTLDKTIDICKTSEVTTNQMATMKQDVQVKVENTNFINEVKFNKKKNFKTIKKISNPNSNQNQNQEFQCKRCNNKHGPRSCPAFGRTCSKCKIKNHFSDACRAKNKNQVRKLNNLETETDSDFDEDNFDMLCIGEIKKISSENSWHELCRLNNVADINFKLDTGAQCNVIDIKLLNQIKAKMVRSPTKLLVSYSGHKIKVLGQTNILVKNKNKESVELTFKVVKETATPILGLKACKILDLIRKVDATIEDDVIFKGLGCVKNFTYDIDLRDNCTFDIVPPRKIPLAIRDDVKKELDMMEKLGVIKKVTHPTPAVSPMVIVKKNKRIRICIDPYQVNKNILRRHYPLQTMEEIATKLNGSKFFTVLDCKKGFWQIPVTERTQQYLTFSTPWGRYSCLRLPFGLASAPEIFQQMMHQLLENIGNTDCSMDDILIYAKSTEELEIITKKVISVLKENGVKLNKEKCVFKATTIKFLGHILSENGMQPDPEKIEAINKLKQPTNVTELQRLLGMITYLAKFIPTCSEVTAPMRELLQKNAEFIWDFRQENSFIQIKKILASPPVLGYYNINQSVKLSVDASGKALGAVLMQNEHPIAYSSRALTETEQRYPQIEKEALAIRFACKKFHTYIYGKSLTIETDHKPLEAIFKKKLQAAPARLQRIIFDILPYDAKIIYKKGKDIPVADLLSRDIQNDEPETEEDLEIEIIIPMSSAATNSLKEDIHNDKELSVLKEYIQNGFPQDNKVPKNLKHFLNFKEELAVYDDIIFKGDKIVIPQKQVKKILEATHLGHLGINRTLHRTRQGFYWKGLSHDVTNYLQNCSICQATQRSNIKQPIIIKQIPEYPFQIVGSDLFHFDSETYIVLVDSYSGFIDFEKLNNATSNETINFLKKSFAIFGTPEIVETDNGPQFSANEFKNFATTWSFKHITSSPHYPRANGLSERAVQTIKGLLKKCQKDNTDIYLALQNWRNTPRNTELKSTNERLMSRITRTMIPVNKKLLQPKVVPNVTKSLKITRYKGKKYADHGTKELPKLNSNDRVRIQVGPRDWVSGRVETPLEEPRSAIVKTDDGRLYRRNWHHLHRTSCTIPIKQEIVPDVEQSVPPVGPSTSNGNRHSNGSTTYRTNEQRAEIRPIVIPTVTTKSGRTVKPIQRMNL